MQKGVKEVKEDAYYRALKLRVINTVKHELIGTKMLLTFYLSKLPGHTVLHYLNKLYLFVFLFLIPYLKGPVCTASVQRCNIYS